MPFVFAQVAVATALATGSPTPQDGSQISYRLDTDRAATVCGWKGAAPTEILVQLGQDENGPFVLVPDAIPEELWLSPVTRGELSNDAFGGTRSDDYELDRLGTLHLTKTLNLTRNGEDGLTGSLQLEATIEFLDDAPDSVRATTGPLTDGPCRATVLLEGERVEAPPGDLQLTDKLWTLRKRSMDALLMRRAKESLLPLEQGLAIPGPHRAEFLWRKSRGTFVVGEELPQSARKQRLAIFSKGQEIAREALELDPDSAEASFFLAAHLGRYNTTHGLVSTFFGLDEFEALALRTIELESDYDMMGFRVYGDAHHALGQFYRLVPDALWMKLLSGVRGNLTRSVEYHRKALEVQPERGDYWKELGVALSCYGTKEEDEEALAEGKAALETAAEKPLWAYSNPGLDQAHIVRLIADPESACGYSRDLY